MSTTAERVLANSKARAAGRDIGKIPPPKNKRRRSKGRRDLLTFLRTYLAARFPLPFSPDHLQLIARLQEVILVGGLQAVAMPRGSGKTTICEGATLWSELYQHRRFLLVVAGDAGKAEDIAESIKGELAHNERLSEDFPEACHPVRALEGIARRAEGQSTLGVPTHLIWTKAEVRLAAQAGGCVIRGAGITAGVRGAKAALADGSQVRPDLVLVDDPQTDTSARSPSQVARRMKTMTSTILGLAGPGKKIACLVTVTVIEPGDLAEQLLDHGAHPEWQGIRSRLMRAMPGEKAMALWDQYTEILREDLRAERGAARATAFYAANRPGMDDGAAASWPERFEPGELSATQHAMNIRAIRGTAAFASEYQNEPENLLASSDVEQITAPAVLRKLNNHDRGVVPVEDGTLTVGVDVQRGALYWVASGWGEDFSGDLVSYGVYPDQGRAYFRVGEIEKTYEKAHPGGGWDASLYAALETLVNNILMREWQTDDGATMRVGKIVIDAGYGESTDTIYKFCRQSRHSALLLPYFGRTIHAGGAPMSEWKKDKTTKHGYGWEIKKPTKRVIRHVIADANLWKSFIATRILTPMAAAGCLSINGKTPAEHRMLADQLAAEIRTRVAANGRVSDEWRVKPNQDNHFLDCLVMSAIGASVLGIKLDEKAVERRAAPKPPSADQVAAAAKPKPDRPPPRLRGERPAGWLGGFGLGGF